MPALLNFPEGTLFNRVGFWILDEKGIVFSDLLLRY
jgi:hypothetical protein